MAEDSGVIKEFLVKIGFKSDSTSEARVKRSIDGVEKMLGKIAAIATSAAVGGYFLKMADDMDKLYWASKRLNSSAGEIKGYEYAISQLGGTADGARSSLESIANFMRSNPGSSGFLRSLGVPTKDLNNSTAVAKDLSGAFRNMPYYRAKTYAQVLGIDPITLQAMIRDTGTFEKKYDSFSKRLGLNLDQLALKSNQFETKFREFKNEGGLIAGALGLDALEKIQPYLDKFSAWVEQVSNGGGGNLGTLVRDIGDLGKALEDLLAAVSKFGGSNFFRDWMDGAIEGMTKLVEATTHFARMMAAAARGDWKTAASEGVESGKALIGAPVAGLRGVANAISDVLPNNPADRAYSFFMGKGLSSAQSRGATAGLYAESNGLDRNAVNPVSGAYGIGQFLGARKKALFAKYGPHPTLDQQLQFVWDEMNGSQSGFLGKFNRATTAEGALDGFISGYERPGPGYGGDMRRGTKFLQSHNFDTGLMPRGASAGNVSMNQKTDIHVHGGGADTAAQVAAGQERVNDRLVRNLKTVVQ